MAQLILDIKDSEMDFFLQLIQKFTTKPVVIYPEQIPLSVQQKVLERKQSIKPEEYINAMEALNKTKLKHGF
jgi:hypothetical protein